MKIEKWQTLEKECIFAVDPWFEIIKEKIKLPSGRIVEDYYMVNVPEHVIIFAICANDKVVIERMYKHAVKNITLSFPTGCVEKNENIIDTAKRELLEETGYIAESWRHVLSTPIDSNKGFGKAHFFVAEGAIKLKKPIIDDMESMEVLEIAHEELSKPFYNGESSLSNIVMLNIGLEYMKNKG